MSASRPGIRVAAALGSALALVVGAGCADADPSSSTSAIARPSAPVVGCAGGGSRGPPDGAREQGITAGPLLFAFARDLADHPEIVRPTAAKLRELIDRPTSTEVQRRAQRRARRTLRATPEGGHGLATLAIWAQPGATVTVALPQEERDAAALVYTDEARNRERPGAPGIYRVGDGDAAVTFKACPQRTTHWNGGVLVTGRPRCLPVEVWVAGERSPLRRRLPIGTGNPCAQPVRAERLLRREPYMGVSCPEPNSIACDRVGLALWLRQPAQRVTATIAGQSLPLRATGRARTPGTDWQGFLQPAGLLDGPLEVTPDRGRYFWRGEQPVYARVRITVERADATLRPRRSPASGWRPGGDERSPPPAATEARCLIVVGGIRRPCRALVVLLVLLATGGCRSEEEKSWPASAAQGTARASPAPAPDAIRDCQSRVEGGQPPTPSEDDVVAGPLILYSLGSVGVALGDESRQLGGVHREAAVILGLERVAVSARRRPSATPARSFASSSGTRAGDGTA